MEPDLLNGDMRSFDDMKRTREWLGNNVLSSLEKRFPVENDNLRLELTDVHYNGDLNPGLAKQKDALLKDRKLNIPVKGTWRLIDKNDGTVLDERKETVMHVPFISDRGTIIYRGNEYSTASQQRLKPGVYSRRKQNGHLESFINPEPGTGRTFRVWMEPDTGILKANVGTANIPLYPLLRSMGVTDEEMADQFGKDLMQVNRAKRDVNAYKKLYERFVYRKKGDPEPLSDEERMEHISKAIQAIKLDREVLSRNLGVDADHASPAVIMAAANRLIKISKGQDKEDDRDEPMFTKLLSVEDLIPERIDKDAGRLSKGLLYKISRDRNLKRLPKSALDPYVDGYFFGSRLVQPLEETNPLSLLEQMHRMTKMGQGGIGDADAVTASAHNVKPGQAGFVDPILGPESSAIGIDVRSAFRSYKGKDNRLYAEFEDRNGKRKMLTPEQTDTMVLALPGELKRDDGMAIAIKGGQMVEVPQEEVDVSIPSFAHMYSPLINLNPMPTAVQAGRQFYGGKFWSQYMPLVEGEAPLVGSLTPDGDESFDQYYGKKVGALRSPVEGTVTRVSRDKITIQDAEGKKHEVDVVENFPFNRLTAISYRPAVKAGDKVGMDSVIARSNFVDDENALRLGRNLSVATLAHRGNSYEDSVVISESAAKKMATDRLYGFDEVARNGVKLGMDRYRSLFPDRFSKKQLENVDENGIVKPGTELNYGDPIILATGPKLLSAEDIMLGKLHKTLRNSHTDKAQVWDHHYKGIVTDAVKTSSGAKVNIKAQVPMKIGDKISNRAGLKGTVGLIIPDDQMPRNAGSNVPFDVLLNPMTILSRVAGNTGVEMQLGKLARKQGKRILLPQEPPPEGWQKWATKQLQDAGIPTREDVFDPELGRNLAKPAGTGVMFFSPFHHLSEKKMSARGSFGSAYDMNEQPAKGGEELQQSKRSSGMDTFQLLAHGADQVLKDAMLIRGQKNDNFWKAFRAGQPLPEPEVPFVYDKFLATLKAGGVNLIDKGNTVALQPMTDEAVTGLSNGEVTSGAMYTDDLKPIKGGLFDPGVTGGPGGSRWAHITLAEPMPNPVFEEPIRRLLGLRQKDIAEIVAGRQEINEETGGIAIKNALAKLDLPQEKERALDEVKSKRGSARDDAVKRLGYLTALEKQGITPDKWVISKLPVLPPKFRPVSRMGDIILSADLNELYRDTIEVNNAFKELVPQVGRRGADQEAELLYDAVKAAVGLGDPITPEGQARKLKGAIHSIKGDSPKCYDSATELLTARGWVLFPEVEENDTVATVNPITGAFEWQDPCEIIHQPYSGKMVHTKTGKLDLLVTPNHNHWVQCRDRRNVGEAQWGEHKKVRADSLVGITKRVRYMTAAPFYIGSEPTFACEDTLAFAEFIGLWAAEGWLHPDGNIVYIAQKAGPDSEHIELVFERMGVEYRRADYEKHTESAYHKVGYKYTYWSINNGELYSWLFTNVGSGAHNKFLSREILSWDSKYLKQVLSGYLFGDGERHTVSTTPERNKTYYNRSALLTRASRASTTSVRLVDSIAELCVKVGLGFNMRDVTEFGEDKQRHTQYRFRISGWNNVVVEYPEQTQYVDYNGTVHCVTVHNGTLIVRRNGHTAVSGNSGFFQRNLFSKTMDLVGRGVVTPDPNLDMDTVGMPEDMAWPLYKNFVIRRLVRSNIPKHEALAMVERRDPVAKRAMQEEMSERPVFMDRAPTWHKFNFLAFNPVLVDGKSIVVSPLITKGYTMDFDGDQVNLHVPVSDKAVAQAKEKMMPSNNLFSLTDLSSPRHTPQQEMVMGLYLLSRGVAGKKKDPIKFTSKEDVIKAYRRGEIGANDPVEIV